jgi:hypothetical protein
VGHCAVGFDVDVEGPHNIRVFLLSLRKVVQEILPSTFEAGINPFLDTLTRELGKLAQLIPQFFATGQVLCNFIDWWFHVRNFSDLISMPIR